MQNISRKELERDLIQVTQLRRLHLTTYRAPALIPWNLQCPVLQDATFDYDENDDDDDECCELISFIRSCGTTLRKMQLPGLATDNFCEIQDDSKILEELTTSGSFGSPDIDEYSRKETYNASVRFFFQNLIDHPMALPRLKILRILDQRLEEKAALECDVARFLDSRLAGGDQVLSLRKAFVGLDQDSSCRQMERREKSRQWRAQGIQVDFE
ncbi:hypothetical protein NLJ89_g9310 [Agrocybe chaxingu]|uniref:Uncharacterized protein n=1 Tax=Agrocybe chaxingu TaxID=84603 RepID=A0A9W8MRC5_9AGAR|nr:hypothetical protein NLJ89_g9310 [Agrocybe chaxingu]